MICFKQQQSEQMIIDDIYNTEQGIAEEEDEEASSTNTLSLSYQNTINTVELDGTYIPIMNILSPSMYMLLILKVISCFSFQVYSITYPVVFSQVPILVQNWRIIIWRCINFRLYWISDIIKINQY